MDTGKTEVEGDTGDESESQEQRDGLEEPDTDELFTGEIWLDISSGSETRQQNQGAQKPRTGEEETGREC